MTYYFSIIFAVRYTNGHTFFHSTFFSQESIPIFDDGAFNDIVHLQYPGNCGIDILSSEPITKAEFGRRMNQG
jgi:hypothetical protein